MQIVTENTRAYSICVYVCINHDALLCGCVGVFVLGGILFIFFLFLFFFHLFTQLFSLSFFCIPPPPPFFFLGLFVYVTSPYHAVSVRSYYGVACILLKHDKELHCVNMVGARL